MTDAASIEVLAEAVNRSRVDPQYMLQHVLRIDPDPWQLEMLQAVADLWRIEHGYPTVCNHEGLNRFTVRSGHGPGKTYFAAMLMHYTAFTRKIQIPCTAPKEKQITTRLWPRFRAILHSAAPGYSDIISVKDRSITWFNDKDWCAIPEVGKHAENLAGYHPNTIYDWIAFIVDEASGVSQVFFPVINGALSSPRTMLLLIGNPTATTGEFYDSHNRPGVMKLFYRRHVKPDESKYVDKRYIDELIERYGRDSPVTKVRGFGEFAELRPGQVIAIEWLVRAREREDLIKDGDGSLPRLRVMVDVADGGEDESVITVAYLYDTFTYYVKMFRYNFPASVAPINTADAAERIFNEYKDKLNFQDRDLVVDSIGVGAGTAGTLIKRKLPVIAYKGGAASDDPKQWRNRRTQSYLGFRDALRDGTVAFAPDFAASDEEWDEFDAQACSIFFAPTADRVEALETKESMRARGIKSPDMIDSCVMRYATQLPAIGGGEVNVEEFRVIGSTSERYDAAIA